MQPLADDPLAVRRDQQAPAARPTRLSADGATFVRPSDLAEATAILAEHPRAALVAGSTDLGVEVNLRGSRPTLVVALDRLPELRGLTFGPDEVRIGAALTLSEIERTLDGRVPLFDALFSQFASRLIRNGATLGGNLGTGSPIGDAPPVLLALDAEVLLVSSGAGERVVALADYFTGYRQSVRRADELIREIRIPLPLAGLTAFHKIAKRRFDDISSVAVGFAIDVADGVVTRARIGLGGVAATPIRALGTESALLGRPWSEAGVEHAAELLGAEGTPIDDQRASSAYRAAMLGQSLRKLYAEHPGTTPETTPETTTRSDMSQLSERPDGAVVGQTMPHESAALHVTGTALYTDDLHPRTKDVLHAHPVQAPHAHARVTALRTGPAYDVPGVVRVLTGEDVPGVNDAGVKHDEPLFPDEVMLRRARRVLGAGGDASRRPDEARRRSRSTTSRSRR